MSQFPMTSSIPSGQGFKSMAFPVSVGNPQTPSLMGPLNTMGKRFKNAYSHSFKGMHQIPDHTPTTSPVDDCGFNELLFAHTDEKAAKVSDACTSLKSLSRLNSFMVSERGRKLYGKETTATAVLRDWQLYGPQFTMLQPYNQHRAGHVVGVTVGYRARFINYWLACSERIAPLDHCWLLLCRYKYRNPIELLPFDNDPVDSKEHYWQFVPYATNGPQRPNPDVYSNLFGKPEDVYIGDAIHIGSVQDFYDEYTNRDGMVSIAQQVCYPINDEDPAKRKKRTELMVSMPQIVMIMNR